MVVMVMGVWGSPIQLSANKKPIPNVLKPVWETKADHSI